MKIEKVSTELDPANDERSTLVLSTTAGALLSQPGSFELNSGGLQSTFVSRTPSISG